MEDEFYVALQRNMLSAVDSIKSDLESVGYSVWKSEASEKLVDASRSEYLSAVNTLTLHPQAEEFKVDDLRLSPWRKLCIGASNGLGDPYAQFLMSTYFHPSANDFKSLLNLFDLMIFMRNSLTAMPVYFGRDPAECGYWNACRIHHYPRGGGFMSEHRDTHFPAILKRDGIPFLQVMACLSRPGEDFSSGGGFVHSKQGTKVLLDNPDSYGSIVFFDGSMMHGVDTVDANAIPDFSSPLGRMAAFANLYETV